MIELVWLAVIVLCIGAFGVLAGGGRPREDLRARRRWDATFYAETHRQTRTDATGVLRCRSCGRSASESAGRCPSCAAML
jgi:hypothetical protein